MERHQSSSHLKRPRNAFHSHPGRRIMKHTAICDLLFLFLFLSSYLLLIQRQTQTTSVGERRAVVQMTLSRPSSRLRHSFNLSRHVRDKKKGEVYLYPSSPAALLSTLRKHPALITHVPLLYFTHPSSLPTSVWFSCLVFHRRDPHFTKRGGMLLSVT